MCVLRGKGRGEGGQSIWVSKSEKPLEKGESEGEVALPSCLERKLLWC